MYQVCPCGLQSLKAADHTSILKATMKSNARKVVVTEDASVSVE